MSITILHKLGLMAPYSFQFENHENYFKRLQFEINSIKVLSEKIQEQIKEDSRRHSLLQHIQDRAFIITTSPSLEVNISDELYRVIHLFLLTLTEYLTTKCDLHPQFSIPAVVSIPQFSSLPCVCSLLWKRLEVVGKKVCYEKPVNIKLTPRDGDLMVSSKNIQTESSSLNYCESCHMSTKLIKLLVHTILEEQRRYGVKETHVSRYRNQLGEDVFGASQWTVMRQWVKAVQEDVKWVAKMVSTTQKLYDKLYQAQDMQELEHRKTVKSLSDSLAIIQSQLEAEKAQSEYLKHQIEEMKTSLDRRIKHSKGLEKTICNNKQQLETLKESMKYLKNECRLLQSTHKSIGMFMKSTLSHESKNISHMRTYITRTVKHMESWFDEKVKSEQQKQRDILVLSSILNEKNRTIEELQTINSSLNKENEELNEQLDTQKDSINEKNQHLEEFNMKMGLLEKSVEESKLREELYKAKIESSGQPMLHCDPLCDMENQRRINKENIKALFRENKNLKITMAKLKKLESSRASTPSSVLTSD